MQDPIGTLEILATNEAFTDPAIDTTEPQDQGDDEHPVLSTESMLQRYRETRDPSVLRMNPGIEPTRFVIKRMNAAFVLGSLRMLGDSARLMLAACAACHEVKLPGGQIIKAKTKRPIAYGQVCAVEAEWIDTLAKRFGIKTVEEIGRVALAQASLQEGSTGPFV